MEVLTEIRVPWEKKIPLEKGERLRAEAEESSGGLLIRIGREALREPDWKMLSEQAREMIRTEREPVAAMSNLSALLYDALQDVNWLGFYLLRGERLTVGPFQGKPACVHIPVGKGVCGTAVERGEVLNVPDVHAFPGHIACDSVSRSEIVLPLRAGKRIVGVLDIDSPLPARFSDADAEGLRTVAEVIGQEIAWAENAPEA